MPTTASSVAMAGFIPADGPLLVRASGQLDLSATTHTFAAGFAEEAHMGTPHKFASRGITVMPLDFLDLGQKFSFLDWKLN